MNCGKCGGKTIVFDTRKSFAGFEVRRRHECVDIRCQNRFTTYEIEAERLHDMERAERFMYKTKEFVQELIGGKDER